MPKIKWPLVIGASAVSFVLAVFLYLQGLDRADKWASVLALFVALITLAIGLVTRSTDAKAEGTTPASPITNNGVIEQAVLGDRTRVRQKKKTYYYK